MISFYPVLNTHQPHPFKELLPATFSQEGHVHIGNGPLIRSMHLLGDLVAQRATSRNRLA
jgi:hypothetical protein